MTYQHLFEIVLDFLYEYDLPKPVSINIYTGDGDYAQVTLMMAGRNDTPTGVSAEFPWTVFDNGIVTATVIFNNVYFVAQIYDEETT